LQTFGLRYKLPLHDNDNNGSCGSVDIAVVVVVDDDDDDVIIVVVIIIIIIIMR
jgi:hypothetical protein